MDHKPEPVWRPGVSCGFDAAVTHHQAGSPCETGTLMEVGVQTIEDSEESPTAGQQGEQLHSPKYEEHASKESKQIDDDMRD